MPGKPAIYVGETPQQRVACLSANGYDQYERLYEARQNQDKDLDEDDSDEEEDNAFKGVFDEDEPIVPEVLMVHDTLPPEAEAIVAEVAERVGNMARDEWVEIPISEQGELVKRLEAAGFEVRAAYFQDVF